MFETGTASDYQDLLERLNTFLTAKGSAFGLTYAGTGDGTISQLSGGASSVAETFTIQATSATNFTVVGSVTGSIGPATVGTPFTHGTIEFLITAGGTAFVSGDTFTVSTAPKWVAERADRGCTIVASAASTGQRAAENVIDGKTAEDSGRDWNPPAAAQTLEFVFAAAQTIVEYAIMGNAGFSPEDWTFEYWDGGAWQVLDTRGPVTSWPTNGFNVYAVASPVSATRYRLNISDWVSSTVAVINAVELRVNSGGRNVAFSQYIWKAPGNAGGSEIYVGAHHFRRVDTDYFNWELAAFDGFNADARFYQQAGYHGKTYLPLVNSSIPYWFVANGQRVIIVAKIGTQYEVGYLGFYDPYFTPGQLPYPIALGGSLALGDPPDVWNSTSWRWSNSTNQHRAFTHSDPQSVFTGRPTADHQMRARRLDGVWFGLVSSREDNFSSNPSSDAVLWPYHGNLTNLDVNLDSGYALFPVMLSHGAPNMLGQLDGVAAATGQGLTAETLVRIGAFDYLAVPNITRTDRNDWLMVALD